MPIQSRPVGPTLAKALEQRVVPKTRIRRRLGAVVILGVVGLVAVASVVAQGPLLWQQNLNGTAIITPIRTMSVAIDLSGNVVAAGRTAVNVPSGDFTVAKFSPDGAPLWQQHLGTFSRVGNGASSVAVDQDENVVAAGFTIGTGRDFTVMKFSPDGVLLWQRDLHGDTEDRANSVTVDKQGNVVAGGAIGGAFALVKFSPDGDVLWQQTPGSGAATSVAVDNDGSVVAAGEIGGDFAVVKFNPDGTPLWEYLLNGTFNSALDRGWSVAVDHRGNVVAGGETFNIGTLSDFTIAKFSPDGVLLWQHDLDGGANEPDAASSVAVDPRGDVVAAGVTVDAGSNFTVMKFSAAGTKLWQQDLSGTADSAAANSVAVNARGDVVAGGITINTGNDFVFTVAKFSRDGTGLWRHDLNGTGTGVEQAFSVAIDNGGDVVAGGETSNPSSALTVLKFDKK